MNNTVINNTVIIYQIVPETLLIYHESVGLNELGRLKQCHGKYINSNMDKENEEWLLEWVKNKKSVYDDSDVEPMPIDIYTKYLGEQITIIVTGELL